MRKGKIQTRIEEALKELEASQVSVDCASEDGEMLHVVVITEKLAGMPMMKRFMMCAELMEKNDPELTRTYSFIFEPVTRKEFETKIFGAV